jgi:RNA polymerase sigma factor (sigma-70 family)
MSDDGSPFHAQEKGADGTVVVIDDDKRIRNALSHLFGSIGLKVELFGSAMEFLRQSQLPTGASCIVLDLQLPQLNGFDLQTQLATRDIRIPIVFITGYGDVPTSVKAMKAGAADFLTKPFLGKDLLDAVVAAVDRDRKRLLDEVKLSQLRTAFQTLTPRERQVMRHVTDGLMNKQIAHEIGISEVTVKVYRKGAMQKMGANSLAELVRMTELLRLRDGQPSA